jgi:hypothetical protein
LAKAAAFCSLHVKAGSPVHQQLALAAVWHRVQLLLGYVVAHLQQQKPNIVWSSFAHLAAAYSGNTGCDMQRKRACYHADDVFL